MAARLVLSLSIAILVSGVAAASGQDADGEKAYLSKFEGKWTATGNVRRNAKSSGNQVKCSMSGSTSATAAQLSGTCTAMAVFSRQISADLKFDPASGRYSGVYTGSAIGPARLSGTRNGDVLTLNVTWPKPVNGDTVATMIIRNSDPGRFTFLVVDRVDETGPIETMTNLTFAAL